MATAHYILPPNGVQQFKQQLYAYTNTRATCLCLDNNGVHNGPMSYHTYEMIAGIGAKHALKIDNEGTALHQLEEFYNRHKSWLLGYIGYDVKNEVEKLQSANGDGLEFPALYFFVPEELVLVRGNAIEIQADNPGEVYATITHISPPTPGTTRQVTFAQRISREAYLEKVQKIRQHIEEGDVYELNLCMEFYAEQAKIQPLEAYLQLLQISPMPFAAYAKFESVYHALCASPERFLKKEGNKLISQPIKGTAQRGKTPEEDEAMKTALKNSEKERAENVMIVDLVRNDLGRSAIAGTVKVEELFGIYTFPQVHQMISTISAQKREEISWLQAISNAFPMGSMTGAPKVKAMELIEHYEESRRGLFSGALGYITPQGDFDFNVMIRSLLYNAHSHYLSYHVGGAITYDSVPVDEYEECMLKASAIKQLWGGKN